MIAKQMNVITYLFGAGASKEALPLVHEIPNKIADVITILESPDYQLDSDSIISDGNKQSIKKGVAQSDLIEDLKWLRTESAKSASVDTLAKKYWLKNEYDNLRKLKLALSVFLNLQQSMSRFDRRYENFFASIVERRLILPSNLRLLTWNYDLQLEMAFADLRGIDNLSDIEDHLAVNKKFSDSGIQASSFNITKLNGSATILDGIMSRTFTFHSGLNQVFSLKLVNEVVERYARLKYNNQHHLSMSFAWEPDSSQPDNINQITKSAIETSKDSTVLVVIGYSFPFFNRTVDRQIIKAMSKLEKVYFQSPDADKIKERFLAIRDDLPNNNLLERFDVDQFVFPNEL